MSHTDRPIDRQAISTVEAPAAIGPYSQAIRTGSLLFVSGQIPLDPSTGQIVGGGIAAETDRVCRNLSAILAAAGTSFAKVAKTTVYLVDMADFATMNDVYARWFLSPAPARATIAVSALPRGARVEIELIAEL